MSALLAHVPLTGHDLQLAVSDFETIGLRDAEMLSIVRELEMFASEAAIQKLRREYTVESRAQNLRKWQKAFDTFKDLERYASHIAGTSSTAAEKSMRKRWWRETVEGRGTFVLQQLALARKEGVYASCSTLSLPHHRTVEAFQACGDFLTTPLSLAVPAPRIDFGKA